MEVVFAGAKILSIKPALAEVMKDAQNTPNINVTTTVLKNFVAIKYFLPVRH